MATIIIIIIIIIMTMDWERNCPHFLQRCNANISLCSRPSLRDEESNPTSSDRVE